MRRKTLIAGVYVLAAGLMLALGAAARYSSATPRETGRAPHITQMSKGMTGHGMMKQREAERNEMAERKRMRTILHKLLENHEEMTRARSIAAMRPLLAVNHTLLERLRNEMKRAWPERKSRMHHSMASRHSSRHASRARDVKESKLVAKGRHLFGVDSCRVCHGPTAHGTAMAPSLHGVGKKYSREKIAHLIRHPVTQKMPSFSKNAISDANLKAIIAFLETLH